MKRGIIIIVVVVSILVVLIGWLAGFPFPRTEINQTVEIDDVCLDTYRVSTHLWIYRNFSLISDVWCRNSKIKCSNVLRIKEAQMEVVEARRAVVKKCLEDFKYCDDL